MACHFPRPLPLRSIPPGIRFKLVTTSTETCPICGGTGWQTVERGKEREAVRCECRVRDRGERLLEAAHIPPRYMHCDLTTFIRPKGKREPHAGCEADRPSDLSRIIRSKKEASFLVDPSGSARPIWACRFSKDLIREKGIQCRFAIIASC